MGKHRAIFADEFGRPRALFGCGICSGSPRMAELAARVGFDVVWIDMEHTSFDLAGAEAACVAVEAAGAIPLVRTTGWRREHLLQALEVGASILVAPLVNDAAAAREMVLHGKFPPIGRRGYNTRSRGMGYGLEPPPAIMERANEETWLFPQVETREAAKNLDEILRVEGIAGIFVGPGDLSADLGRPGDFSDPELNDIVRRCVAAARTAGLHAGILVGEGTLLETALDAGADLCVIASDFSPAIDAWRKQLQHFKPRSLQHG